MATLRIRHSRLPFPARDRRPKNTTESRPLHQGGGGREGKRAVDMVAVGSGARTLNAVGNIEVKDYRVIRGSAKRTFAPSEIAADVSGKVSDNPRGPRRTRRPTPPTPKKKDPHASRSLFSSKMPDCLSSRTLYGVPASRALSRGDPTAGVYQKLKQVVRPPLIHHCSSLRLKLPVKASVPWTVS